MADILMAEAAKITLCWNVTRMYLAGIQHRFGRNIYLHLQGDGGSRFLRNAGKFPPG
jgi:hypothetical protein